MSTQPAEVLHRCGYGVAASNTRLMGELTDLLAAARAEGAAEALRDAAEFCRERSGELWRDSKDDALTPLRRSQINGQSNGWDDAADHLILARVDLLHPAALSSHTTERDPT